MYSIWKIITSSEMRGYYRFVLSVVLSLSAVVAAAMAIFTIFYFPGKLLGTGGKLIATIVSTILLIIETYAKIMAVVVLSLVASLSVVILDQITDPEHFIELLADLALIDWIITKLSIILDPEQISKFINFISKLLP